MFQTPVDPTPEMTAVVEQLETTFRRSGLYLDSFYFLEDPEDHTRVLVADWLIGDVAFAKRTQDPEQEAIDRKVQEMGVDMRRTDFDDAREGILRRLAEGKSPLGEED